ncbi:MAG: uncharacterized protein QOH49_1354 [Acidobacteriota bacterium]|nr:uncharacterized protein [Acidobacteriota bacterium]
MSIRKLIVLAAALLLCAACARVEEPAKPQPSPTPQQQAAAPASYEQELEQWKAKRLTNLKSEDGWLTLIGLFWLKEGENRFGSDPTNEIVLPDGKTPALAGTLRLAAGKVTLEAKPDAKITLKGQPVTTLELKSDEDGEPTVLELGSLSFHVVKRGERLGLRVKDRENPARAEFKGTDYYPADRKWVVNARFEPYQPPKQVPILNVLGMETEETSPGTLAFEVDGRPYKLEALKEKGEEQFFIIFADQTSGKETYRAGRYLYADPPGTDGVVRLDFNKAYSPPCAFTRYATCPLPPAQNHLPLRVEAGERYLGH